jgi:endonuclease/exonuclease/phosphatase family metal-dependent hydrolase
VATPFTAMTWNVENLFRPGTSDSAPPEDVYRRKLANLAEVIQLIGPDVLALQELGGDGPLADLQEALDGDYPHRSVSEHDDHRHIRVGFLSRLALTGVTDFFEIPDGAISGLPDTDEHGTITHLGRGALLVTVEVSGARVRLLTAHLKSKLVTYPGGRFQPHDENERARGAGLALIRRTAEAVALRVDANALMTGNQTPLVLLGDLNDESEAQTTQILLGPPDGDPRRPDKGDDVRLYDLSDEIPEAHRFSRIFHGRRELIDHILVSHELLFHVQQVDTFTRNTTSITEDPTERRDAAFSDHSPVFARFLLPETLTPSG